jgi:3-oxoacyl-[acyl-carrier protein] reductase
MPPSYLDLNGKAFAITGAASGMGRATALLLAKQGCNVGLMDITPPDAVAAEVAKLVGDGHAVAVAVDVTDSDAVEAAFQKAFDAFGRLDGAAHLAGTVDTMKFAVKSHGLDVVTDKEWDQIMSVNLTGVKNCLRSEFRLIRGPGSIINSSSISGQAGNPFGTAYSASKWAVIGLSKGAAGEVGDRGIRVNAIAP